MKTAMYIDDFNFTEHLLGPETDRRCRPKTYQNSEAGLAKMSASSGEEQRSRTKTWKANNRLSLSEMLLKGEQ